MTQRPRDPVWRGAALVAATYVYFLIFAEFAFVELARPKTGDGGALRAVMGALGGGGVAGSVLAIWLFNREVWGARLGGWLLWCAVAACGALVAPGLGVGALALAGAGVGLALGGATVTLAAGLRAVTGRSKLGFVAGLGTGAAYAFCNVPLVFNAEPAQQTIWAIAVALAGAALAWPMNALEETAVEKSGMRSWVPVFLALVWMDSAAFYIIQHTEALKHATWSGVWTLGGNAAVHFGAALLAGVMLDRGRAAWIVALAAGLLGAACLWIKSPGAELPYVAGVSFYSAALVYAPARAGGPKAAAWVYAVAGWGGSALGIGMAQDLHGVPTWFVAAAVSVVGAGLVWRRRLLAPGAAVLAAGLAGLGSAGEARADEASVLRGREVYISEGCIHCHSQYVRPQTEDVVRWGPARPLEELLRERPPLFGNRRQGPDLLNVGNRRSREWNRLHLQAPREVSPGSRMPSYARLFAPGEARGEELLDYLESLGAGTVGARLELISAWRPVTATRPDAALGAKWFGLACAQCHGPDGAGDGPLAARLVSKPADLTRSLLADELLLSRLIKFGRPGTAMPGHESLDDATVVSLARHVRGLQQSRKTPTTTTTP